MSNMLDHLRICMEAGNAGVDLNLLSRHKEMELLDFLDEVEMLEMRESIKLLHPHAQDKLMTDIGFCQILQWLVEEGIALKRIEKFLLQYPEETPSVCDYGTLQEVLLDEDVSEEYLYEYWRYYREYSLSKEEKEVLWNGLSYYHDRTNKGLDSLAEEERKRLYDPVFASGLLFDVRDMEMLFSAFDKKGVPELLRMFLAIAPEGYIIVRKTFSQLMEEPEEIGNLLRTLLGCIPEEQQEAFFCRWIENGNLLYDLGKLVFTLPQTEADEMNGIWNSRISYIGCIYGKAIAGISLEDLDQRTELLLIYAITHNKRHFLRLAEKHGEDFRMMSRWCMLADEDFYRRLVNLNTLNERDLMDSMEYQAIGDAQKACMLKPEYTFAEIRCLHEQKEQYIRFYHQLASSKVDDRLRGFREIIKKQCLPENMPETEMGILGKHLSEKKLSVWMKGDFSNIQGLTSHTAVRLLVYREELHRFLPEIETELQAKYVLRNRERLAPFAAMDDFNRHLLDTDEAWLKMKEDFQFPEGFISENKERILRFLQNGGAEIMTAFYRDREDDMEKARRLVTAEVMGRFEEMKYHKDDLSKEIDFELTGHQKAAWMQKERLKDKNGISVWEEDALLPVMQIGEVPTYTCMSYLTGNHRHCLLSCFDSNKKVIFASMQGKIVFRAILRLTKGCYVRKEGEESRQEIEFADLLAEDQKYRQTDDPKKRERLVLFLERPYYAGLSPEQERGVVASVIKLTEQKAEMLGAELAVSTKYKKYLCENSDYVMSSFHLYISKSKNGSQYLDSLGGSASVSDSGSYRSSNFFIRPEKQEGYRADAA